MQPQELSAETSARLSALDDYMDSIISGDCCDVMQQFPANSIDLVLTDRLT